MLDRHDLYELCVQSPDELVPLLVAVHGHDPTLLGEDFCGTAALSRVWVDRVDGGRAIAVDLDAGPLARVEGIDAIEVIRGDVVDDTTPDRHAVDVIYAGNFSIGERHARAALLGYLRHARQRVRGDGIIVCDLYGGESAFLTGDMTREHPLPDGGVVRYTWEQRAVDPTTGMVVNALHFTVCREGSVDQEIRDAFVYRWRLWGVPELRDAMLECGFARTEVYGKVPDAVDDEGRVYPARLGDGFPVDDSFDVLVVGRTG